MVTPAVTPPEELDRDDLQGLVVRGYGDLTAAQFWLLEITNVENARAFLAQVVVTPARKPPDGAHRFAIHVALTWQGLERLAVPVHRADFARELTEGMDHPVRADSLGDDGCNDPGNWQWGHRHRPHVLLMLYARETKRVGEPADVTLDDLVREYQVKIAPGFRILEDDDGRTIGTKRTTSLVDQREHFGWRDGISTPGVSAFSESPDPDRVRNSWTEDFPAGEFVLGYRNVYGNSYTDRPSVDAAADPTDLLPRTLDGRADLGRNGTYLVYREMSQHVPRFWGYLVAQTAAEPGSTVDKAVRLGAKMVGRWPDGAPVTRAEVDAPPPASDDNQFTYFSDDRDGLRCPLGAHIRRANPRDQLAPDREQEESSAMVRKHQMIRRGRAFGPPLVAALDVPALVAAGEAYLAGGRDGDDDIETTRGLHFICLVTHIGRQFEMVQRAWLDSPNFQALYKDSDPLVGVRRRQGDNPNDQFTCPARPVRRKYAGLPQFTQLVGGGYFFLPGIRALKFIARGPQR